MKKLNIKNLTQTEQSKLEFTGEKKSIVWHFRKFINKKGEIFFGKAKQEYVSGNESKGSFWGNIWEKIEKSEYESKT